MTILNAQGQPVTAAKQNDVPGVQKTYLGLIGSDLVSLDGPNGLLFTQTFIAKVKGTGTPEVPLQAIQCARFMYATPITMTENATIVMLASDGGVEPAQMNIVLTQAALKDFILALTKLVKGGSAVVPNGQEQETDNADLQRGEERRQVGKDESRPDDTGAPPSANA